MSSLLHPHLLFFPSAWDTSSLSPSLAHVISWRSWMPVKGMLQSRMSREKNGMKGDVHVRNRRKNQVRICWLFSFFLSFSSRICLSGHGLMTVFLSLSLSHFCSLREASVGCLLASANVSLLPPLLPLSFQLTWRFFLAFNSPTLPTILAASARNEPDRRHDGSHISLTQSRVRKRADMSWNKEEGRKESSLMIMCNDDAGCDDDDQWKVISCDMEWKLIITSYTKACPTSYTSSFSLP